MIKWTRDGQRFESKLEIGAGGNGLVAELWQTRDGKDFLLEVSKTYKTYNGARNAQVKQIDSV